MAAEPVPTTTNPDDDDEGDDAVTERSHPLGDYFRGWEGKSGLYFLSPYFIPDQPDAAYPVKVGLSRHRGGARRLLPYGGIGRRMDSYLLCYPYGFYVYAVLQCDRTKVYDMERFFHQYFTSKGFQTRQLHSHREEWFVLTRDDVATTIRAYVRYDPAAVQTLELHAPPDLPVFVDTNGRLAARPKQALAPDAKASFQGFMTPHRVPQTLPRKKNRLSTGDEDEDGYDEDPP